MPSSSQTGYLIYALGILLLSAMDVAGKDLVTRYPVSQVLFGRALLGYIPFFLLLYLVLRSEGRNSSPSFTFWPRNWRLQIIRTFLLIAAFYCFFASLKYLALADATAYFLVSPLIALVLARLFLREQVDWIRWFSVLLGGAGVLIMLYPTLGQSSDVPLIAPLLVLLATLAVAVSYITTRRLSRYDHPLTSTFWANNITLPIMLLFIFIEPFQLPDLSDLGIFFLLALLGVVSHYLVTLALKMADVSLIAVLDYSAFPWAVVFGLLFFADWPGTFIWAGAALVLVSGVLVALKNPEPLGESIE